MAGRNVQLPAHLEAQRLAELAAAEGEARELDEQISDLVRSGATARSSEVVRLTALMTVQLRRATLADNPSAWLQAQNDPLRDLS